MIEGLASKEPAPAGGSASAALVAIAAALLEKVALLSVQRWSGAEAAHRRAHELRLRAEELIEHDKHAYLDYIAAIRSHQGLEDAQSRTIDVPLEVVRAAVDVVNLAHELSRHGNPNLRPDAATAAITAHAAISAAAMMVQVNVGLNVRDERLREALKLMRDASESVRRLGALNLSGAPGRAPAQSRDTARRSPRRSARGARSSGAARRSGPSQTR